MQAQRLVFSMALVSVVGASPLAWSAPGDAFFDFNDAAGGSVDFTGGGGGGGTNNFDANLLGEGGFYGTFAWDDDGNLFTPDTNGVASSIVAESVLGGGVTGSAGDHAIRGALSGTNGGIFAGLQLNLVGVQGVVDPGDPTRIDPATRLQMDVRGTAGVTTRIYLQSGYWDNWGPNHTFGSLSISHTFTGGWDAIDFSPVLDGGTIPGHGWIGIDAGEDLQINVDFPLGDNTPGVPFSGEVAIDNIRLTNVNVFAVGDVNLDDAINAADIDAIYQVVRDFDDPGSAISTSGALGAQASRRHNLTPDDSFVDAGDVAHLVQTVLGTMFGDADLDGFIAQGDLDAVLLNWGQADTGWAGGDFNGNNLVEQGDLDSVLLNWGFQAEPGASSSAVPEPASFAVLGLWGVALLRRRLR